MKNFVYLIQGCASKVINYAYIQSSDRDLITLSYDKNICEDKVSWAKNIYFPNSTWAEGRNKLLEEARVIQDYKYYIFCDDDVEFLEGDFTLFEELLDKFCPMIGIPLSDTIKSAFLYDERLPVQHPNALDQIVQALHRDVVLDGRVAPLETKFDKDSWYYACEINQFLILRYYWQKTLQFNTVKTINSFHTYEKINLNEKSLYVGGTNAEDMQKVRQYIIDRFGPQPPIANTLFHDESHPRLIFGPTGRTFLVSLFRNLLEFEFRNLCSILRMYSYRRRALKWHLKNNKDNLIIPEPKLQDFKRPDYFCKN